MSFETGKVIARMIICFLLGVGFAIHLVVLGVLNREKYNKPEYLQTMSEDSLSAYQLLFLLFIIVGCILLMVTVCLIVFFGIQLTKTSKAPDPGQNSFQP